VVKFLIIRFSSIGDIVLTTPVIRCLKQQVEEAEIHFFTKRQYESIVESNPYIDKVHYLDDNLSEKIKELKDEFYDHIIDLHNNLRTSKVKRKLSLPAFTVDKLNYKKWLIVNFKINKLPDVHIVDRYLDTVKVFDIVNDMKGLDFFIPQKDEVEMKSILPAETSEYIAFAIGGQWYTKQMPPEKIISVISGISKPVVLLGGKEDVENALLIKAKLPDVINMCGSLNINQSASVVKQSKMVITNDTGLMHIAAAFKKNIISLWGNTIPEFGMYPYLAGSESQIMEVRDLKCRPCTKIGFRKCPKKHFKCMMEIDEKKIQDLTKKIFSIS